MYTFYFKQVTDNVGAPRFKLVAFRGQTKPSLFKLGRIYELRELYASHFRIVLDGCQMVEDTDNTKMFYAKGYRGPEKSVNKSVVYTDQEEDLLVQSLIFGPSGCETPSIGPLPPQAPISISQKSQDELEPLPSAIPESGKECWAQHNGYVCTLKPYHIGPHQAYGPVGKYQQPFATWANDPAYSPGDLEKLKRELREQFEQGATHGDPSPATLTPPGTMLDPRDSAKADAAKVEALDTANSVKWNFDFTPIAPKGNFAEMDTGNYDIYPGGHFVRREEKSTRWTKLKDWFWGTNRVGF